MYKPGKSGGEKAIIHVIVFHDLYAGNGAGPELFCPFNIS
jgi:hypothetical protein